MQTLAEKPEERRRQPLVPDHSISSYLYNNTARSVVCEGTMKGARRCLRHLANSFARLSILKLLLLLLFTLPRVVLGQAPLAEGQVDWSDFTAEERVYIEVYERVNRSVVNITTKAVKTELFFAETPVEGAGSGSVIDQQGHVLTNYHVVEGAQTIRVTLYNGETYDAKLVGQDPMNDIAVLRVAAPVEEFFPVRFGDSSRLRVGQRVIAIGNPFGLERTMTLGIVSSLNRSLPTRAGRSLKSIIQIDAALNRGNSGGPLLDSRGRLIGMNTAIASSTGENTGVGFAIPVNTLARVVPQLIQNGRVIRPDIGITRVLETERGLVVVTLTPGGPAERAGVQGFRVVKTQKRRGPFVYEEQRLDRSQADLIVAIDGKKVRSADDLLSVVEMKRPGESVELGIVRQGQEGLVAIVLGAGE
ncbi:MAG: trypsin-like peptidase domain-containing protein [Pirellulales bacterium]